MLRHLFLLLFLSMTFTATASPSRWIHCLYVWLDSADVRGTDTAYVRLSDKRFTAYLNNTLAGTHAWMQVHSPYAEGVTMQGNLGTRPSGMASVGLSYRGWGLSLSRDFSRHGDSDVSYSFNGTRHGIDYRYHKASSLHGTLRPDRGDQAGLELPITEGMIQVRTRVFNAYYVFNRHRFSHPASTSHNTIQLRSAGSWIGTINYWHASYQNTDSSTPLDFTHISLSHFNLGVGYAYHYVFGHQRCLLFGSLTPLLTVWHRNRFYSDSHSVVSLTPDQTFDFVAHHRFVYNFHRYLLGYQCIFNYSISPHNEQFSVHNIDWLARFFIGVRF